MFFGVVECTPIFRTDLDGDFQVNSSDSFMLLVGSGSVNKCSVDSNEDEISDEEDMLTFLAALGQAVANAM